jgi:hypothetical protein
LHDLAEERVVKRPITTHQVLSAYQRGEIGYMEAMDAIGVPDFSTFLNVLADNNFHMPRHRGAETNAEVEGAIRILSGHMNRQETSS